jgi:hypothetical protein
MPLNFSYNNRLHPVFFSGNKEGKCNENLRETLRLES